ncbi:hypothetical protein EJ06DRAFT_45778 [Trichodelitschia bisporula]|uniref:Uncharacterized protein n=1 Tax=Trichodelitschia bisporula TaxID=703511 RepID=A0A6G1HVN8_9PEZI|nr:hypothetical protein EJ06DRAFT_45778 [Trichodelitschia bisporula]
MCLMAFHFPVYRHGSAETSPVREWHNPPCPRISLSASLSARLTSSFDFFLQGLVSVNDSGTGLSQNCKTAIRDHEPGHWLHRSTPSLLRCLALLKRALNDQAQSPSPHRISPHRNAEENVETSRLAAYIYTKTPSTASSSTTPTQYHTLNRENQPTPPAPPEPPLPAVALEPVTCKEE